MIKKILTNWLFFLGLLTVLIFETTIGVPLVYIFLVVRLLSLKEGFNRVLWATVASVPLALSVGASATIVFILCSLAVHLAERVQQRTPLQQLAVASLIMIVIVLYSQLQLLPLSFIYLLVVWLTVAITQSMPRKKTRHRFLDTI